MRTAWENVRRLTKIKRYLSESWSRIQYVNRGYNNAKPTYSVFTYAHDWNKMSPKTFLFTLSFLFVAIVLTVRQISSWNVNELVLAARTYGMWRNKNWHSSYASHISVRSHTSHYTLAQNNHHATLNHLTSLYVTSHHVITPHHITSIT